MPELCRWGNVIIRIRIDDHAWPHVHVKCAEHDAALRLRDLVIFKGQLPRTQRKAVIEWASEHIDELNEAWLSLERHELPSQIAPPRK